MNLPKLISGHIKEVYEGNNWTDVGISDTLSDVNFKDATTVTPASSNTIASFVLLTSMPLLFHRTRGRSAKTLEV